MTVEVHIVEGPVRARERPGISGAAGAELTFEGVVRAEEEGRAISALEYQVYEPMAQRMLERIGREVAERFGVLGLVVEHSRGRVPVGGCSLRAVISARHRKEALGAMEEFIDRLKRDVPIWKTPVWASPG